MEVLLKAENMNTRISIIYRPPSLPFLQFMDDFTTYLDFNSTMSGNLLLVGDFIVHFNCLKDSNAKKIKDILTGMNFTQLVGGPTHELEHTLDLVLARG